MIKQDMIVAVPFGLDEYAGRLLYQRWSGTGDGPLWIVEVEMSDCTLGADCPHPEAHDVQELHIPEKLLQLLPCKPRGWWLQQARRATRSR